MAAFYLLWDIHFGKCFLWHKFLSEKHYDTSPSKIPMFAIFPSIAVAIFPNYRINLLFAPLLCLWQNLSHTSISSCNVIKNSFTVFSYHFPFNVSLDCFGEYIKGSEEEKGWRKSWTRGEKGDEICHELFKYFPIRKYLRSLDISLEKL